MILVLFRSLVSKPGSRAGPVDNKPTAGAP